MYQTHFGLQKSLFDSGIALDSAVFLSAKHEQLIAKVKLALASPTAAIALKGPAGVGKTTLTAAALRATTTRLALAWLNDTPTNAAELLELLLVELGITTQRVTRVERLQLWRQFLGEMHATESRLFIIAERTEDLSPSVLRGLDSLTASDPSGVPGANVVLLGEDGLDRHLAAPELASLRQRIALRQTLEAFTEAELQDYLRYQVSCAGGDFDRLFAPGTSAALYRYSRGNARLTNNLCETALQVAASEQLKLLTAELVQRVAVSFVGLSEPSAATVPAMASDTTATANEATRATVSAAPPTATVLAPAPNQPTLPTATATVPSASAAPPMTAPAQTAVPTRAVAPAPSVLAAPVVPAAANPASLPAARVVPAAASPAPSPTARVAATPPPPRIEPPAVAPPRPTAAPATPAPVAEFDGAVTDIVMDDFPVLIDAVDEPATAPPPAPKPIFRLTPAPAAPAKAAAAPSKPAAAIPVMPSRPTPTLAAPTPVAAKPPAPAPMAAAAPPGKTVNVAPPAKEPPRPEAKPATAATAKSAPTSRPAAPAADDDALEHQTQTMKALSVAKSIDDISSSMAETLFGDAEFDLLTAALASAANWTDEDEAADAATEPEPPKRSQPVDDPFNLFDLGSDAPLELMDDTAPDDSGPPRKAATPR